MTTKNTVNTEVNATAKITLADGTTKEITTKKIFGRELAKCACYGKSSISPKTPFFNEYNGAVKLLWKAAKDTVALSHQTADKELVTEQENKVYKWLRNLYDFYGTFNSKKLRVNETSVNMVISALNVTYRTVWKADSLESLQDGLKPFKTAVEDTWKAHSTNPTEASLKVWEDAKKALADKQREVNTKKQTAGTYVTRPVFCGLTKFRENLEMLLVSQLRNLYLLTTEQEEAEKDKTKLNKAVEKLHKDIVEMLASGNVSMEDVTKIFQANGFNGGKEETKKTEVKTA